LIGLDAEMASTACSISNNPSYYSPGQGPKGEANRLLKKQTESTSVNLQSKSNPPPHPHHNLYSLSLPSLSIYINSYPKAPSSPSRHSSSRRTLPLAKEQGLAWLPPAKRRVGVGVNKNNKRGGISGAEFVYNLIY
jgi:hypothetical protein